PVNDGSTKVIIYINRLRSIIMVAFWALCGFLMALAMPFPAGGILFLTILVTAWIGIVTFLGGYLIKKEIIEELIT
ncbi:MAG: hypothetical protein KGL13_06690, partial [Gammaproteobacteria bacterium]|nr:hypothetical protein [Gammaproteobacteria bacterium]